MSRTFQDHDFLVWEVYPSGGLHGFSDNPHLIFNCLTNKELRPRYIVGAAAEPEAQKLLAGATDDELLAMLERARDIP